MLLRLLSDNLSMIINSGDVDMKKVMIGTIILAVTGCASDGLDRRNKNSTMQVSYGKVQSVENIDLKSEAGKGAAIGGLWGLAANSRGNSSDMATGVAVGALIGGLTTKIAEGSSQAWGYMIQKNDGSVVKVISDNSHLVVGDCAVMEMGETTNIRRVASEMCQSNLPVETRELIDDSHRDDANECNQAKQELLAAESADQLERAKMKVEVLCH